MADSLTQDSRMQVDGKAEDSSKARNPLDTQSLLALLGEEEVDPSTLPARLLAEMDSYVPTIPEPVLTHFLQKSGCHVTDPKIKKLVALAAQKFIFDVTNDALQYCKHRKGSGFKKRKNGEEIYTLTMEDLCSSLNDHGIQLNKPEYFVGNPSELHTRK